MGGIAARRPTLTGGPPSLFWPLGCRGRSSATLKPRFQLSESFYAGTPIIVVPFPRQGPGGNMTSRASGLGVPAFGGNVTLGLYSDSAGLHFGAPQLMQPGGVARRLGVVGFGLRGWRAVGGRRVPSSGSRWCTYPSRGTSTSSTVDGETLGQQLDRWVRATLVWVVAMG